MCLKVPIVDSPLVNISDYQQICSAFLTHVENIGGRVLVHCISGLCGVGFGAFMFLFVCSFLYLPIVDVIIAEAALY